MTEKLKAIFNIRNEQSPTITVRICSTTGDVFQETFPNNQLTIGQMKFIAMKSLLDHSQMEKKENYKLISMDTKRTMDEQKTLKEEKVKDGDEYFLAKKITNEASRIQQVSESDPVDENLIKQRTQDLPLPSNASTQAHQLRRTDFRADLTRMLLSLIETSQKLLWYRPDAEQIFQHVERVLSRSIATANETEINPNDIGKLIDVGFTDQQARFALKKTKSDLNAAMEFLLTEPTIDEPNEHEKEIPMSSSYSHHGPFVSFRQFRQKYSQPNPMVIQSLEDMGFNRPEIILALQVCRNDQNLACDYLIGDEQQQRNIIDASRERELDPNCRLFQALMDSPVIQRAMNNPQVFFVLLQLYEDPSLITIFLNEPDIGYLLVELSRVYHSERLESNRLHSTPGDHSPPTNLIDMLTETP